LTDTRSGSQPHSLAQSRATVPNWLATRVMGGGRHWQDLSGGGHSERLPRRAATGTQKWGGQPAAEWHDACFHSERPAAPAKWQLATKQALLFLSA
jgi:hypothetical protein